MCPESQVLISPLFLSLLRFFLFSSAINPILYNAMSDKFRKAFRRLLSCGKLSEPPHNHLYCYNNADRLGHSTRASPMSSGAAGNSVRHHILSPLDAAGEEDDSGLLRRKSTNNTQAARNRVYKPRLSEPAIMPHASSSMSLNHLSPGWQATPSSANATGCSGSSSGRMSVATQAGCRNGGGQQQQQQHSYNHSHKLHPHNNIKNAQKPTTTTTTTAVTSGTMNSSNTFSSSPPSSAGGGGGGGSNVNAPPPHQHCTHNIHIKTASKETIFQN